ncbi:MAG: hypothetical protein K2M06_07205, partial [Muribaculaceae bacterium]|nr:hypothetical protein [Muribaculaceae bacterium]
GALDFDMADAPEIPIFNHDTPETPDVPAIEVDDEYNPFAEAGEAPVSEPSRPATAYGAAPGARHAAPAVPRDWDKLYENFTRRRDESFAEIKSSAINDATDAPAEGGELFRTGSSDTAAPAAASIQIRASFIAAPSATGLMLIDQHRAHIRILYERFIESLKSGPIPSQRLIFPETINLSPSQSATLTAIADTVAALGFDLSFLGDATWAVNGQPALPASASPSRTLMAIIEAAAATDGIDSGLPAEELLHPLALAMARAAAIRHGRTLSPQEMDSLVADLFRTAAPDITPDGLSVIATLDHETLLSLFR